MFNLISYSLLFLLSLFLQIFFFDNLTISIFFSPLVYIAFIALLPVETKPIVMLLCGLLMGVAVDWAMGLEGINTAVTLFAAIMRRPILIISGGVKEGGVPSVWRMGNFSFFLYLFLFVGLHHLSFFLLETLSLRMFHYTLLRFVLSSTVTVLFCWLLSQIFFRTRNS